MAREPIRDVRPPSYLNKSALAAELCVSEATIDDWTRKGILPKPRRLAGSVRWCWAEVVAELTPSPGEPASPFMEALRNVT